MQTFLVSPDFHISAACLDPSRLGNQVYREALTLIRGGWPHHRASKMWRGYTRALAMYGLACLDELKKRGWFYPRHYKTFMDFYENSPDTGMPWWLGDERLHSSHRAALLYKNYDYYKQFGWKELPAVPDKKERLGYFWPV